MQLQSEQIAVTVPRRRWLALATILVLAGLLAAGGALRLYHINWDQHQHVHPDERFIVWVADSMRWPGDLATALDPRRSPLNPFRWPPGPGDLAGKPRDYAYGHFPLYLLLTVAHAGEAAGRALAWPGVWQHLADYSNLTLTGRAISAFFDLGTTLMVFLLARRLYRSPRVANSVKPAGAERGGEQILHSGTAAGLLAAAAYAIAVLPIQLSHFATVDLVLTFCVVAAVTVMARAAETGGARTWWGAGALAGLAIGSKSSAVLLFVPLVVAALYQLPENGDGDMIPSEVRGRAGMIFARRVAAGALAALAVFLLTNPFAALDARAFVRNILAQNAMVSGIIEAPYMRQYAGTAPYWYFVQQLSQWGLGWPLGLAAWGGFLWQIVQAVRRRITPAQATALAWALAYFAVTGPLFAKFLRYTAPLLPFLLVFAAGAALALYRSLGGRWGRGGRMAWTAAAAAVLLFTAAWTLLFSGVYRQEHPWIQASRWIYAHVPAGSKLLSEHWDDALPLAMDEIPGLPPRPTYVQVELPLYDTDDRAKLDKLVRELSSADYVILASNRLAGPIQRLPVRYPMTSQYYRMLFNGDLGYRLVAEFTAYPRAGQLVVFDDHADESFSVYDHPRVRIFANQARLSAGRLEAQLARYLPLSSADRGRALGPGQAGGAPDGSEQGEAPSGRPSARGPGHALVLPPSQEPAPGNSLLLGQPVDTLPVVADFRWNRLASGSPPLAILLWWLVLSVFGWVAWPLVFPLLGGLRDRGYSLARLAGWLAVGWVHWLGASLGLWQNRTGMIAAVLALLAACAAAAWYMQRRRMAAWMADHRRALLASEAVFAAAFLVMVGFRFLNPDLWQPWNGGEKFMEFAFLNAILRSPRFPPYDPYFAGGIINYYYYGLYLVSLPIKLTGIVPEVAFNLAVPGLFALASLALFGTGASLARSARRAVSTGLLAVLLALVIGNLASFQQVTQKLAEVAGPAPARLPLAGLLAVGRGLGALLRGAPWPGFDYWAASRVIPYSINEFPLWSFLFADLHPHLIAMPVGVMVVGLALNWVLANGEPANSAPPQPGVEPAAQATEDGADQETWEAEETPEKAAGADTRAANAAVPVEMDGQRETGVQAGDGARVELPERREPTGARSPGTWDQAGDTAAGARPVGQVEQTGLVAPAEAEGGGTVAELSGFQEPRNAQLEPAATRRAGELPLLLTAGRLGLLVIALGALGPANTWDLPVYFLLVAGAFWIAARRARRVAAALEAVFLASLTGTLVALAYLPFYAHYQALLGDRTGSVVGRYLGLVREGSPLQPWLIIWGFYLLLAYSITLLVLFDRTARRSRAVALLLTAVGVAFILLMLDRPTAALAALPLVLALGLLAEGGRSLPARLVVVLLLLALGLGILAGTELVYLRDFLAGGDWYRMNTLFKFGMPAWLVLGLPAAATLPWLWSALERRAPSPAQVWRVVVVGMLVAGLLFVPLGIPARLDDRFPGARPPIGALDGTAYMTVGQYSWPDEQHVIQLGDEYQAIHWLLDHVTGTPVIAEAPAGEYVVDGEPAGYDYYRAGGLRVASLTGFPTFVGQHQYEQRPGEQVSERTLLGQEFFETPDLGRTRALIRDLNVDYIYVGTLERLLFPQPALAKFDRLAQEGSLRVVYQNLQVTIYQVQS